MNKFKTVGIVVAVEREAFLKAFGTDGKHIQINGFDTYLYRINDVDVVMILSGAGEILAAGATQVLICAYSPDVVINAGICGGLNGEMKLGDLCLVDNVVHYGYDITAMGYAKGVYLGCDSAYIKTDTKLLKEEFRCGIKSVNCASADRLVTGKEERIKLGNEFNCSICEMESAGVIITCKNNEIPCILLKAVSDSLEDGVEDLLETDWAKKSSDIVAQATLTAVKDLIQL